MPAVLNISACMHPKTDRSEALTKNPDAFNPVTVPDDLRPYIRRALVADCAEAVDMTVPIRATGYHYLGWTWRGRWQGELDGVRVYDTNRDGMLHLAGQIDGADVVARFKGRLGQVFLEFTATGQARLLGINGAVMRRRVSAPQVHDPALEPYLMPLYAPDDMPLAMRVRLLFDIMRQLPVHEIEDGIEEVVAIIEAENGALTLSSLFADLQLSERQFREAFRQVVGLPPKAFCTALQVNQALNRILRDGGGRLADIAAGAGFADQAHMTRAFRAFLGKAPKQFAKEIETTIARFVGMSRQ